MARQGSGLKQVCDEGQCEFPEFASMIPLSDPLRIYTVRGELTRYYRDEQREGGVIVTKNEIFGAFSPSPFGSLITQKCDTWVEAILWSYRRNKEAKNKC